MFLLGINSSFVLDLIQPPVETILVVAAQTQSFMVYFVTLEYIKVGLFFVIAFLLCLVLFGLAYMLSVSRYKDSEKLTEYECGFEPFDAATRLPFDVHFYIVAILFLIFDVEIALLVP